MNLPRQGAKYCSQKCGTYARRLLKKSPIPSKLTDLDRWVRWKLVKRGGRLTKVPLTTDSKSASSTDSTTWATHAEARESSVGDGVGFVLNGDGIACVDLDHVLNDGVLDPRARRFLDQLDSFYVEVSPSGDGIHAWVEGGSPDGRKVFTLEDGLKVEWYSAGRYLTVTGKVFK